MDLPGLAQIEAAAEIIYGAMRPTPQYTYPLLNARAGTELWIKHENHTPLGAFKIRGNLVYMRQVRDAAGVITATRGNHGQAVAFAARRTGLRAAVYVPVCNSRSKNDAMRALGAEVIEFGDDFQTAREEALRRAANDNLHFVPSFHELLVAGVATYALEFFRSAPPLDTIYVPIGLGSGICGVIAAREALGLRTEIVGVVSAHAPAYYESFLQKTVVEAAACTDLADGVACRIPEPAALEFIWKHVSRVLTVSDDEVRTAMRAYFDDTHNVAEGAGACGLAAALKDSERKPGARAATVLTGGNVDREVYARILCRVVV